MNVVRTTERATQAYRLVVDRVAQSHVPGTWEWRQQLLQREKQLRNLLATTYRNVRQVELEINQLDRSVQTYRNQRATILNTYNTACRDRDRRYRILEKELASPTERQSTAGR